MQHHIHKSAEFSRTIKNDPIKRNLILLKLLMQWTGFWPENQSICFKCFAIWILFNWGFITLSQICFCFKITNNLPLLFQTMSNIATSIQVFVKLLSLIVYRRKFKKVISTIWFDFLAITAAPEEIRNKISDVAKYNRIVVCLIYSLGALITTQYLTFKLITGERSYPLPLAFESPQSPYFELIYLWEWSACIIIAIVAVSTDILFATLLLTCVSQFNIISSNLKMYGTENDNQKIKFIKFFSSEVISAKSLDLHLLIKFIQQHNLVIKTCQETEQLFEYMMFFQLLGSAAAICLAVFALTKFPELILQFVLVPIIVTLLLFCYCWFCNELIEAGSNCSDAAYSSAWYYTDVNLQKYLILIIRKANEELTMTAGGFTQMNRNVLVQIFKFTMSVCTVLGTLTKKDY